MFNASRFLDQFYVNNFFNKKDLKPYRQALNKYNNMFNTLI